MLKEMEEHSFFDTLVFTDTDGVNHDSRGRVSDAVGRDYYVNGIEGKSGKHYIYYTAGTSASQMYTGPNYGNSIV